MSDNQIPDGCYYISSVSDHMNYVKGKLFKWLEKKQWITKGNSVTGRTIGPAMKGFDYLVEFMKLDTKTGIQRKHVVFTQKGFDLLIKLNPDIEKLSISS